jgi:hypothetical protein
VKALRASLGNVALDGGTISRKCKQLFGSTFNGVFLQDSKFPAKDGYSVMNNDTSGGKGIHWLAVIKRGKTIYVYDSFGRLTRNILPIFTKNMKAQGFTVKTADPSDQDQYGTTSRDCGHRCISALMIAKKQGIQAFMNL